jgi:hypothetical protein
LILTIETMDVVNMKTNIMIGHNYHVWRPLYWWFYKSSSWKKVAMDNDLLDALLPANNHPAEPLLELMSCGDPCPLMPQLFLLPAEEISNQCS